MLSGEVEARPLPEQGRPPLPQPSREYTLEIPKCTNEGVGYLVESWPCRLAGKRYRYVGESRRSGYQKVREHCQEIFLGKKTHLMVLHFEKAHKGNQQEVLMRIVRTPERPCKGKPGSQ